MTSSSDVLPHWNRICPQRATLPNPKYFLPKKSAALDYRRTFSKAEYGLLTYGLLFVGGQDDRWSVVTLDNGWTYLLRYQSAFFGIQVIPDGESAYVVNQCWVIDDESAYRSDPEFHPLLIDFIVDRTVFKNSEMPIPPRILQVEDPAERNILLDGYFGHYLTGSADGIFFNEMDSIYANLSEVLKLLDSIEESRCEITEDSLQGEIGTLDETDVMRRLMPSNMHVRFVLSYLQKRGYLKLELVKGEQRLKLTLNRIEAGMA